MEFMQDGPTPLYVQLADLLRQHIEEGVLEPGVAIPSEPNLVKQYNVSRTTVRQALNMLASQNFIVKVQGKGTYVRQPSVQQDLISLQTINEVLTSAGLSPEVQVLSVESQIGIDPKIRKQLHITEDDKVLCVKRLHLVDKQPIAYAVIYLSSKFEWRFSVEDLTHQSIYSWLESQSDVVVDRGQQVIQAVAASEDVAEALDVNTGIPVLYVENTSMTQSGDPIDFTQFYFPSDRYALVVSLHRTHRGISLTNVHANLDESENTGE